MSSAMEYRVVYRVDFERGERARRTRSFPFLSYARYFAQISHGGIEWREPGGVWQTLTEGEYGPGMAAGSGVSSPGAGRKPPHDDLTPAPSVSVPSVPEEKYVDPGNMHTRTLRRGRWF